MTLYQWLSIASVGFFIYAIIGAILVCLTPLNLKWVRFFCYTGIVGVGILSLNTGFLYLWQHFLR